MTNTATQRPSRPARPHQPGDVVYLRHPHMAHDANPRPMVVMGRDGLVLPLSTEPCRQLGHTTAYYIERTHRHRAHGHPAPNRAWTPRHLPPADGRLTAAEWGLCWDAYEAYLAR